jgi:phosphoribosylamine--glycine ligase
VRVALIGSGGREHALALGLAADPAVEALVVAPGNPGIAALGRPGARCPVAVEGVDMGAPDAIAELAEQTGADLVVIGPEAPLVAGAADAVRARGIACFGPSAQAARLEGSKAFAKQVMAAAGVPTARSRLCLDERQAAQALDNFGPPYVVKNDGLAAGKGVVVTADRGEALEHARACARVVIEEYLAGPEVSLLVVTDGRTAVPLLPAQDFKRVGDGDTGPNTGGMGAYAPLPWAPADLTEAVLTSIVHPTLAQMRERDTPFAGVLYVGLALTAVGPRVIEFNARFGDPEAQVVLALLGTPLAGLLHAAAIGQLAEHEALRWHPGAAVGVVVASAGYPSAPRTGDVLTGALDAAGGPVTGVLHAGTARRAGDGALVSAGGRVLCCTATGDDLAQARTAAYALVDTIGLDGSQHRRDIALAAAEGSVTLPRPPGPVTR